MHTRTSGIALFLAFASVTTGFLSTAATVKDREGAIRQDKAALENDARWIYNDYKRGFAEAGRTGKPLLVVLRCVPCLACAGIDSAVLLQETDLAPVLDQFVCVRIIDANALDLNLFQVDYDLSFSTVFFNGDGTVYGRYGSWRHQKDPQDKTTAGYKRALEAALAIHRGYPGNKAMLIGKQGSPAPFKTPSEAPSLADKYKLELDWDGNLVRSCIHCHQVGEALRENVLASHKRLPLEMIYPWPAPETIGLNLAPDSIARVESVAPKTPAAAAGFKAGDEIIMLEGQSLVSIADVSWVLHHTPASGEVVATVRSSGSKPRHVTLSLPAGWRDKTDISRRNTAWQLRGMGTGGLLLEDMPDEARAPLGIKPQSMALLVKHVGEYGKHAAAKAAGFRKDDVITEFDGKSERLSESQALGLVLEHHDPGDQIKATVLREGKRVTLSLPVQR